MPARAIHSRRDYLKLAGMTGVIGVAGCLGDDDGGDDSDGADQTDDDSDPDGWHIGYSNFISDDPFEAVVTQAAEWWAEDHDNLELNVITGDGTPEQQIQDCRNLLQQDVDGLVITAGDSNALATIAEEAEVPVFGADIPTNSEEVGLHVAVSQENYGQIGGERLVEQLRENRPDQSEYRVLEVIMNLDNSNSVLRHENMNAAIDEHDDVEVVRGIEMETYDNSEVAEKVQSYLVQDPDIDGIFSPWAGGGIGATRALEHHDMLAPKGEEGHVTQVVLDASSAVLDLMLDGYVDLSPDQPNTFYVPIALKYMVDYLEGGEDENVLPEIGSTVEAEDLQDALDTGIEHRGAQVWGEPLWAPGEVKEFATFGGDELGYPFFVTSIPIVSPDNADNPFLWGNIQRELGLGGY